MGGRGHNVEAEIEWIWVDATSDEPGDVRHIGHQHDFFAGFFDEFVANFDDALKIRDFHEGGVADKDDFGFIFEGLFF